MTLKKTIRVKFSSRQSNASKEMLAFLLKERINFSFAFKKESEECISCSFDNMMDVQRAEKKFSELEDKENPQTSLFDEETNKKLIKVG